MSDMAWHKLSVLRACVMENTILRHHNVHGKNVQESAVYKGVRQYVFTDQAYIAAIEHLSRKISKMIKAQKDIISWTEKTQHSSNCTDSRTNAGFDNLATLF